MMALCSTETHNITLKNLALYLGPNFAIPTVQIRLRDFLLLLLRCKCDRIFDSIEELKHSHGAEIRSRDSIIIPIMIEENRTKFSLFHYKSPLSKVYRRDTRDSLS